MIINGYSILSRALELEPYPGYSLVSYPRHPLFWVVGSYSSADDAVGIFLAPPKGIRM